ncbi:MAG: S-layer homology domain-containing protein [Candidatus Avispirillum sp.]
MKKIFVLLSLILATVLCAFSVSAEGLSPALDIIANESTVTVSALSGESVSFDADKFADAAGDSHDSVRITSLPQAETGTLYYNDAEATVGQVIAFDKLEDLSFVPAEGVESASFNFTYDGAYTMTCSILYGDSVNNAPTVLQCPALSTFASTNCSGTMRAADADGDALSFEVLQYPENGQLSYDEQSGDFVYSASEKTGEDSFVYRVRDEWGDVSGEGRVSVNVKADTSRITFADVEADACCASAAAAVTDAGIMTFTEDGGKNLFRPTEKMTRLEFLVAAMDAFGADKLPKAANTGFADSDDVDSKYRSYVYSAAKLGIVKGIDTDNGCCFMPDRNITKAEAAVILNNIIGYEAEEASSSLYTDGVPAWAQSSVDAVCELGIMGTSGGRIGAGDELTRSEAAQMFYGIMNLIYE